MDAKGFLEHIQQALEKHRQTFQANLLTGSYKTPEEYQRSVGIFSALTDIINSLPNAYAEYEKKVEEAVNQNRQSEPLSIA